MGCAESRDLGRLRVVGSEEIGDDSRRLTVARRLVVVWLRLVAADRLRLRAWPEAGAQLLDGSRDGARAIDVQRFPRPYRSSDPANFDVELSDHPPANHVEGLALILGKRRVVAHPAAQLLPLHVAAGGALVDLDAVRPGDLRDRLRHRPTRLGIEDGPVELA